MTQFLKMMCLNKAKILHRKGSMNDGSQQKKIKKVCFILLKGIMKFSQSVDTSILLALVRPTDSGNIPKKRIKTNTNTRAGAEHRLTEGEKCSLMKESGPVKDTKTVDQLMKEIVEGVDSAVHGDLSRISEGHRTFSQKSVWTIFQESCGS